MTIDFSIVLPTYNRVSTIDRAIESVLAQSHTNFELLVIDDGSNDSSATTCNKYFFDTRFRYIYQKHQGVSAARNKGIQIAKGQYIAFLDSDDEWINDKLERQHDYIANNPQFSLLQTNEKWIRNGKQVQPTKENNKNEGDIFCASLQRCLITPSSVVVKATLFDKHGFFDTRLLACEDYDMWIRLCCHYHVGLLPEQCLIRYGGHADQLSTLHPAMDRFRIFSLHKLLFQRVLNSYQQQQTERALITKARILIAGANKRKIILEDAKEQLEMLASGKWQQLPLIQSVKLLLNPVYWQMGKTNKNK